MEVVKKVVLAGYFGVGKTSLVRKFVFQQFSDKYLTTIGVKIDKKVVDLGHCQVKMMLWDIAGESTALKIPQKYFTGAHGLIYVFDLSRPETYKNLGADLFEIQKTLRDIPIRVLANKADLVGDEEIEEVRKKVTVDFEITSAKSGLNVEEAFIGLAKEMAQ